MLLMKMVWIKLITIYESHVLADHSSFLIANWLGYPLLTPVLRPLCLHGVRLVVGGLSNFWSKDEAVWFPDSVLFHPPAPPPPPMPPPAPIPPLLSEHFIINSTDASTTTDVDNWSGTFLIVVSGLCGAYRWRQR